MFRQYLAHRKRMCVCVCEGGGGGGGGSRFAQSPPFAWKSKEKSIMLHILPFISSPLAIAESTSSEVVLPMQCTVK